MHAMFDYTRTQTFMQLARRAGIRVGSDAMPAHSFGIIVDPAPNPMGQACHIDALPGQGQFFVHMRSGQPSTRVYQGHVPTLQEFRERAGVEELGVTATRWAQHATWAMLGRSVLEAGLTPVHGDDCSAGDALLFAGPVPHAGPPAPRPRIIGFSVVGGSEPHDTDQQWNPWNVALQVLSPAVLTVVADYWEHNPHK